MKSGREDGLVIVSVVLVLALLGLVTGGSLWLTRAELWAAGRARSVLQATYTAEAGVRHGLALLAPDVDWAAVVDREPAALAFPEEPGPWPIGAGGWVAFPGPPFGYALEVVGPADARDAAAPLVVRSTASAVRGAAAVAVATAARMETPYAPAALVLTGGHLEFEAAALGTERDPRVELLGRDRAAPIGTSSVHGLEAALSSARDAGGRVQGEPTSLVRPFDIGRFARRSGLNPSSLDVLANAVGAPGAPVGLWVRGGTAPVLRGAGVLLVDGDLDVATVVDWDGVLIVDGRLRIGGEPCRVEGMVWSRGVAFAGPCRVVASEEAVADADRALRLPRLAVLTGLLGE